MSPYRRLATGNVSFVDSEQIMKTKDESANKLFQDDSDSSSEIDSNNSDKPKSKKIKDEIKIPRT